MITITAFKRYLNKASSEKWSLGKSKGGREILFLLQAPDLKVNK